MGRDEPYHLRNMHQPHITSKRNNTNIEHETKPKKNATREYSPGSYLFAASHTFMYFFFCIQMTFVRSRLQQMQSQRLRRFPFRYRFFGSWLMEWCADRVVSVASRGMPFAILIRAERYVSPYHVYLSFSCIDIDRNLFRRSERNKIQS